MFEEVTYRCERCGAKMTVPPGVTPGMHYKKDGPQRGAGNVCTPFGDPQPWKREP